MADEGDPVRVRSVFRPDLASDADGAGDIREGCRISTAPLGTFTPTSDHHNGALTGECLCERVEDKLISLVRGAWPTRQEDHQRPWAARSRRGDVHRKLARRPHVRIAAGDRRGVRDVVPLANCDTTADALEGGICTSPTRRPHPARPLVADAEEVPTGTEGEGDGVASAEQPARTNDSAPMTASFRRTSCDPALRFVGFHATLSVCAPRWAVPLVSHTRPAADRSQP